MMRIKYKIDKKRWRANMDEGSNSVAGIALIIALLALILSVMNFVGINPAIFRIQTENELQVSNEVQTRVLQKKLEVMKKKAKEKKKVESEQNTEQK